MAAFKKGQAVTARTTRGVARAGTFVATHSTMKGDWLEIKPADKEAKNFKTRPALVEAA